MKKLYYLAALLLTISVYSQHKVAAKIEEIHQSKVTFHQIAPLTPTSATTTEPFRAVSEATFATLNNPVVADVMQNRYEFLEVQIPYNDEVISVELYRTQLFHRDFHVDTDKQKNVSYNRGVHYRGIIKGHPESVASFNFFDGELNAIISNSEMNNLVVGKLQKQGNISEYIIYSDAKMLVPSGFQCAVKDDVVEHENARLERSVLTERCVTFYFEIDHTLYQANGSNVEQTTNWMTSVYNNVETLYALDGITVSLKSLFIWTEPDPYFGDSSVEYLYQFNEIRPVFDGDIGQLVGADPGGLGGIAVTIDGLCSQNNFSYSDVQLDFATVPTWSWTVQVITHEFGHLMGSQHTHSCAWNGNNTAIDGCGTQAGFENGNCPIGPIPSPSQKGTIMSYCHLINGVGISFANGFGEQPAMRIMQTVDSSPCLSVDCVTTCINTVASISVTDVTSNSAIINWTDISENPGSYEFALFPLGGPNPGFQSITNPSFDATDLQPNTFYRVRIRPICESATSYSRETIFATSADWCAGVTITDTGGPNQDHGNMESYTRVLMPTQPNKKIKLVFSSFHLEDDYDFLYIYDGPNTASPEITGGLTGNIDPGTYISTSPSGALTIQFESDQFVTESGYIATVSCEDHLGVNDMGKVIDFSYYPNPTTGTVNILSNSTITSMMIYNVQGRLLYKADVNSLETQADISAFASGTYFFKLKFGNEEAHFKIVRN